MATASPKHTIKGVSNGTQKADAALPPTNPASRVTLRDVVVEEMTSGRHADRPLLSRIALVGKIISKDDPLKDFMEETVKAATAAAHAADPLGGRINPDTTETVSITGLVVELSEGFLGVFESEPAYLLALTAQMHRRLTGKRPYEGIRGIHVALYTDDVRTKAFHKYSHADVPLSSSAALDKEIKLETHVVDAVFGLTEIGKQLATQGKVVADTFLANLKQTHAQQLPKGALIDTCVGCGLFLTLEEYLGVYLSVPEVIRPSEVVHPIEPPLAYE